MEIIAAALILIILVIALAVVGTFWLVLLSVIAALAVIFAGGIVAGLLFVFAVFVGSLIWEICKHYREERQRENLEALNLLDNESL